MNPMSTPLKVIIMAGGTGGHVFPALAVAEVLRSKGVLVEWMGGSRGLEAELVPAAGITLHRLTIEGVRGKGLLAKFRAPFLIAKAIRQARRILQDTGADAVLGMGGFASGPGGIAAWMKRIPLLLHEQNAVAGTTNRILSRFASVVMEAFPGALPGARHVGNPVRAEIGEVSAVSPVSDGPLKLLVLGGSLGAMALNQLLPEAVARLPEKIRPTILHQCGRKHIDAAQQAYQSQGVAAEILPFIDDMASAYEWADVVVCRAGALTVSELTMAGRCGLLVPYPHAIDDHQAANARWLVNSDAAVMYRQDVLDAEKIAEFIWSMTQNRKRLLSMSDNARKLALPNAALDVAGNCELLAQTYRREAQHG